MDELNVTQLALQARSSSIGGFSYCVRICEQMRILVLDTKNQVVENISRYQGTVNSSVLRAAEIYRPAVIRNCPGVIICHNHPSGDPTPSPEDIAVTEQLVQAGRHLDIELVDHLVIGNQRYVSLKERMKW